MYQVSAAYLSQMMHRATRRRLTGCIADVDFTGDDIVRESFEVSARAASESDTKIGGVFLGELELTFLPSFLSKLPKSQFEGAEVSISVGLWIPDPTDLVDGGSWVDVPVGIYTLQAPKISKKGVTATGYDHMAKLDKSVNINVTSASVYGYLSYIARECGVEIGNSQAEIEALPNGQEILPLYAPNDIETCRDLLYWVAQACGCFACAGRDGKIYLRKFGNSTGVVFDEDHRDVDIVFSSYITKWTGVSFVDIKTQYTRYYGLEVDNGLTMNMGANPLLQTGSPEEVDRRRRAVLNAVAQIQYTPFYMNSARDPIFDLGDTIPFTGGISDGAVGCVMYYDYTLSDYSFEGYGDNPALANSRSKTDKNIAGLMKATAENEITYYIFTNLDAISFGSDVETRIAKMRFTSMQKTTVKIFHEFILDMLADLAKDCSYEIRYYLDDELITYKPHERIGGIPQLSEQSDAELTLARDLFYVLRNVEPEYTHTWEVRMITHGITSTDIDVNNVRITLEGQRLYGEDYFAGILEAEDELDLFSIGGVELVPLAEGTGEDAPKIIFNLVGSYITTEDGEILTTEDGDGIIW